jgi:hypothetical protein
MADIEAPTVGREHRLGYRRFQGHVTSVWCSCGWTIPTPRRIVTRAEIRSCWSEHIKPDEA